MIKSYDQHKELVFKLTLKLSTVAWRLSDGKIIEELTLNLKISVLIKPKQIAKKASSESVHITHLQCPRCKLFLAYF